MYVFYTEVLKKDETEFWRISMRRWWALFTMKELRDERIKKANELKKQNEALAKMRAL